jgi:WD40 repeat protein
MNDSGLVRVWGIDGETKAPEGLRGHQGPVYAASFSRDGKFILTGGADKSGRLWHVDRRRAIAPADQSQNWTTRLEELIQLAGKTAGRNLTTEEWSNSFPDADYQPTFKDLPTPATDKQDYSCGGHLHGAAAPRRIGAMRPQPHRLDRRLQIVV